MLDSFSCFFFVEDTRALLYVKVLFAQNIEKTLEDVHNILALPREVKRFIVSDFQSFVEGTLQFHASWEHMIQKTESIDRTLPITKNFNELIFSFFELKFKVLIFNMLSAVY